LNESAVEQEQSDRRNTPGNNDSGGEDHNSGVSSYAHPISYTCSSYYRLMLIMFTQRHNWSLFYIAGNDVVGKRFLNEGAAWDFWLEKANYFDLNESVVEQEQSDRRNTPENNDMTDMLFIVAHCVTHNCSLCYSLLLIVLLIVTHYVIQY